MAGAGPWTRRRKSDPFLDVFGASEQLGDFIATQTTDQTVLATFVARKSPFQGAGDPGSLVTMDLMLYSFGYPWIINILHRPTDRTYQSLIVCNLGATMRLGLRRSFEPKIVMASAAAELVGSMAVRAGSEVSLAVGGCRGEESWQARRPVDGTLGSGSDVDEPLRAWASRPASCDSMRLPPFTCRLEPT